MSASAERWALIGSVPAVMSQVRPGVKWESDTELGDANVPTIAQEETFTQTRVTRDTSYYLL